MGLWRERPALSCDPVLGRSQAHSDICQGREGLRHLLCGAVTKSLGQSHLQRTHVGGWRYSQAHKSWAPFPEPPKMGMAVHTCNPSTLGGRDRENRVKVIYGYRMSFRPVWAVWDSVEKKRSGRRRKGGRKNQGAGRKKGNRFI